MNNFFRDKKWTKKNIDKETERLLDRYYRATRQKGGDINNPRAQAIIAKLKQTNPLDVSAIIRDTFERICALNKVAEKSPRHIEFVMEFSRDSIDLRVRSVYEDNYAMPDEDYAMEICKNDKTMPSNAWSNFSFYWLNRTVDKRTEDFLTKWEKFFCLK